MKEKTNLTIRIEKEVLDKARDLGLNLSSVTENFLKTESLTKDKGIVTPKKLRKEYNEVFLELAEILEEWGISIKIGGFMDISQSIEEGRRHVYELHYILFLTPEKTIDVFCDEIGEVTRVWQLNENWPIQNLYNSEKIMLNLIETLHMTAKNNEKRLSEIKLLKNISKKLKGEKREEKKRK